MEFSQFNLTTMTAETADANIYGAILAGGQGIRMGASDKPLVPLLGRPLIDYVIKQAQSQVEKLVISVRQESEPYRALGLPLAVDDKGMCAGPLAGIYSAMKWYQDQGISRGHLACFPADVPFFPDNIVATLAAALAESRRSDQNPAQLVWCETNGQPQPLFSLWSFSLLLPLRSALESGIHGPRLFTQKHQRGLIVELTNADSRMFHNVNTVQELRALEAKVRHA